MDFCGEINLLLRQRNYKSIGDKFYVPNSTRRPDRNTFNPNSLSSANFGALPSPFDSLCKKFFESMRLMNGAAALNVAALQPVLNSCREFFK